MNKYLTSLFILSFLVISIGCQGGFDRNQDEPTRDDAVEFAQNHIIVDGHDDIPSAIYNDPVDISEKTDNNFDYVKAQKGGLNAPFMSIYIPADLNTEQARERADSLIHIVKNLAQKYPDKFALSTSPEEIKEQFKKGLISMSMGMENGSPLGTDLSMIQHYYDRGIRYITLAHSKDNQFSDSSYDTDDDTGLTELGEKAVRKMNEVGMMIDVSHLSEQSFYDIIEITKAPVIASHSSARYFTPGWERNMSDDMLEALAENDGVVMVNFGSSFIKDAARKSNKAITAHFDSLRKHEPEKLTEEYKKEYFNEHYAFASLDEVADHFDHIVNLIGIDHVGLGSDFDGVGNSLPKDLKNAAQLPNLLYKLIERGYTKNQLKKVTYRNIFRVWNKVEAVAESLQDSAATAI